MKYAIKSNLQKPIYLQLYEAIKEDIIRGHYIYGAKLPSKRTFADDLGISTITVEHAYSLLCEEGYTEARTRSGYFVIFRKDDGFAKSSTSRHLHINEVFGESDDEPHFPFPTLAKTMRYVLSEFGDRILVRSPNKGCTELCEAIREYLLRSKGINAEREQIIIGAGAEYLYGLTVKLLSAEIGYAIESPSYEKIEKVYRASGAVPYMLPLSECGIESNPLWACPARVLHITPYRSYPSGVSANASKRHEYLRWGARDGHYIVEDDFESEFSKAWKNEETLFSNSDMDNVIYMNTFSKTISPALRVGYMIIPKHLVETFEEKLGFYSCTVPTYIQLILAELITSGEFERHINRVRRERRKVDAQRQK